MIMNIDLDGVSVGTKVANHDNVWVTKEYRFVFWYCAD
jgi:hypothetical protein